MLSTVCTVPAWIKLKVGNVQGVAFNQFISPA